LLLLWNRERVPRIATVTATASCKHRRGCHDGRRLNQVK
jgi:hypothetical protein